jgi:tRNA pseudouridine-54 N-methylase
MRCALAGTVFIVFVSGALRADEEGDLKIDKFRFAWTIVESGKVRFLIEKDETSTQAWLRTAYDKISMTPEDAEAIGAALAKTDEFFEKLNGKIEKSESIYAGKSKFHVIFATSDKGVFYVSMAPEKSMKEFARLAPAQAKELAGAMRKARRAAALVDQKIKL